MLEDGRVAKESVELGKDEFRNGNVFFLRDRFQPLEGGLLPLRVFVEPVQQDVGVYGEHAPTFSSSGSTTALRWSFEPQP